VLSRRLAWGVAIAAAVTMAVSQVDRSMLGALAPVITDDLHVTESEYGWIVSAFSIAYLFATPLAGWWIDRFGARRGLTISVLVWSIVAGLHGLAGGFGALFALRIALGVSESPGFPGAAQAVQRTLPAEDRARGFGVLFTGSSIAFLIVPPLASWMYSAIGWRETLLVTSSVGAAWLAMWLAITRRADVRARLDTRQDVEVDEVASAAAVPRGPLAVRDPRVARGVVAIFAAAPVVGFAYSWSAKLLVHDFAVSQGQVGKYMVVPALCYDAASIAFGDLVTRLKRPRLLFAVATIMAACFALLPLATTPWTATAVLATATGGAGGQYTLATSDLLSRIPPNVVSYVGGILAAAQSLAHIVMGPLLGYSVDATGAYTDAAVVIGLWVVPGSTVWLLWRQSAKASRGS
jgi:ACS family hexuronate transporter-like MFS transporter